MGAAEARGSGVAEAGGAAAEASWCMLVLNAAEGCF